MSTSNKIIAGLVLVLALVLATLYFGYDPWSAHQQGIGETRATVRYNGAIKQQKDEAAMLLIAESTKAEVAERALNDFKTNQELKDAANKNTVAGLENRLRYAAGAAGRLRDPNTTGCRGGGGGSKSVDPASADLGAEDTAEAGGLFSVGATALLQRLTREADDINIAYASCRADAMNMRKAL